MAIEVEELFIQPFKEIVERGQQTIEYADDDDDPDRSVRLAKAGQNVVKEGERALRRIQPLWDKQVTEHGDAFREAIRKNDELDEKRRKLEDMLYDFEDFIEPDTFDPEKFTELQATAKTFALDILDTLKRMKIERSSPPPPTPSHAPRQANSRRRSPRTMSQRSTQSQPPPLPAMPPLPDLPRSPKRERYSEPRAASRQSSPERPDSPTLGPPKREQQSMDGSLSIQTNVGRAQSIASSNGNSAGLDRSSTVTSKTSYTSADLAPPPKDVWAIPPRSTSFGAGSEFGLNSQASQNYQVSSQRSSGTPSVVVSPTDTSYALPWAANQTQSPGTPVLNSPLQQYSIPEDSSAEGVGYVNQITTYTTRVPLPSSTRTMSTTTTQGSSPFFDSNSPSPATQAATSTFTSPDAPAARPATSPGPQKAVGEEDPPPLPIRRRRGEVPPTQQGTDEIERPQTSMTQYADGLILANETALVSANETAPLPPPALAREPDLNLTPKSTIYLFKGFCDGAREIQKGPGSQGIKHTAGYGSGRAVGRCVRCEFNRELAEVKLDFDQDPRVNSALSGVLFRPRFLWKSHISTANTSGHMYGCLFCTATGRVTAEDDATVFPNQAALLRHLARHQQPLPHVPGVSVMYGKVDRNMPQIEDYDIHFPDPPVARTGVPDAAELASLPTATACKPHVLRPGERRLVDPDGQDALRFFEGARIVGVEFPERFGGKWAYGWHDGHRAAFPTKSVDLDLPRRSEFPLQGGKGYTGVVRWKWDPKDKESWLGMEKKEVITNIGWVHQDHWCWSGINSKGRFGVFPSSHIDPLSVKEELVFPTQRTNSSLSGGFGGGGASTYGSSGRTGGGKKSGRGFFGVRRRVSSAASVSSASTGSRNVTEII